MTDIKAPNETLDVRAPCSDVTLVSAPWPLSITDAKPVPDSVAVFPLPLASGHMLVLRSNSPGRYQAFTPAGSWNGNSGAGDGAGGADGGHGGSDGGDGGGKKSKTLAIRWACAAYISSLVSPRCHTISSVIAKSLFSFARYPSLMTSLCNCPCHPYSCQHPHR